MRTKIRPLSCFLLILLFVYAAISKLLAPADFQQALYNQTFPHWMAAILLYTLIPAELLTVTLLSFSRTQSAGLWLSASLLFLFTGYILLVLLHLWSRVPCSCGGILKHMPWEAHLAINIFFLLLALAGLFSGRSMVQEPTMVQYGGKPKTRGQSRHI